MIDINPESPPAPSAGLTAPNPGGGSRGLMR